MLAFSAERRKNRRLQVLDVLRGIAVLLVLCRHWNTWEFLTRMGWTGVDLFFVLSGFLVSRLLYSEYDKNGNIGYLRFFVRRGFKIYPLFYLLLLGTALVVYFSGQPLHWRLFLQEGLFIQNYLGGIYVHTWSLAVEEHFYVALLLLAALFFPKRSGFARVCFSLVVLCLIIRIWNCTQGSCNNHFSTHTRLDSLLIGVLAGYLWRYGSEQFRKQIASSRNVLLLTSVAVMLIFAFVQPESMFTQTAGFTLLALAGCGLLFFGLTAGDKLPVLATPFALTGYYSYAIYLFHIPAKLILGYFGFEETTDWNNAVGFWLYIMFSIGGGIVLSELIELPLLRFRDRVLPSRA